VANLTSHF